MWALLTLSERQKQIYPDYIIVKFIISRYIVFIVIRFIPAINDVIHITLSEFLATKK